MQGFETIKRNVVIDQYFIMPAKTLDYVRAGPQSLALGVGKQDVYRLPRTGKPSDAHVYRGYTGIDRHGGNTRS